MLEIDYDVVSLMHKDSLDALDAHVQWGATEIT
jgi:hypothetical protein